MASQADALRQQISAVHEAVCSTETRLAAQLEARVGEQLERAASVVAAKVAEQATSVAGPHACEAAPLSAPSRHVGRSRLGELEDGDPEGSIGAAAGDCQHGKRLSPSHLFWPFPQPLLIGEGGPLNGARVSLHAVPPMNITKSIPT